MNHSMQPAVQRLFQVPTLEAVSREQLEKFVEEYPCFGFGHYLLSRKLRAVNADEFLAATRKTSLYFSNPFWLQWMLENTEPAHVESLVHREVFTHPDAQGQIIETIHIEAVIQDEEPPFVLDETGQPWPEMENPEAPAETTALHVDPEVRSPAAELLQESIEKAKALRDSIQKINEDFHSHNGQPAAADIPVAPVETVPVLASKAAAGPNPEAAHAPISEAVPVLASEATPAANPEDAPAPVLDGAAVPIPEAAHAPISEAVPVPEATPSPNPEAAAAAIPESPPLFEPLHTVDYFASQGIRLTLDENPTDPLGRQLKSFTEWLRTMRRLPQKDREIIPDRAAEQRIQNFAAHSIEGKEPVTETMAEVLAKQGMPERARIVYEKLSLLNPDKSAYFAAKIEQLNIP